MIHRLKVSGLLSFGPAGVDLELKPLNVLIGPNGSGKSNLLEVLALLRAAPKHLPQPIKEMGGVREWMWKGPEAPSEAVIEALVANPKGSMPLRHTLHLGEQGERFEVFDEKIENEKAHDGNPEPYFFYRFQRGRPVINTRGEANRELKRETVKPEESVLSQVRDPERYPELSWLQGRYEAIRLYRNWSFGPAAGLRRAQSTHDRSDFLVEGGENLPLVLSKVRGRPKIELLAALRKLYAGIEDFNIAIDGGSALLYLEESGGRSIPASRLSDGTLRYLCLLTILLHPEPPPLIALEEPELGLHPDVLPTVAELLVSASERTQLVVTTHSQVLVDALGERPERVVICSKQEGESSYERLDASALQGWLEEYSLGEIWRMGEIGGNRW